MKREKQSSFNVKNAKNAKKFISDYLRKALIILPLTFLFTPLFTVAFGYHPEIKYLKILAYFWYAFFIYLGMTLTVILRKRKNLAYPIIAVLAFLCRNIMEYPALNIQKHIIYSVEVMPDVFETESVIIDMLTEDFIYLAAVIFASSLIAGFIGAFYARKTALDFVNRRNTLLFVNISVVSGIVFYIFGDKQNTGMFALYLICFVVSYFLVRNFAYINRQLEVYAERGAYNVSGTKRIYLYYFLSLIVLLPLPFVFCFFIVPHVINFLVTAVNFIIACFFGLMLLGKEPSKVVSPDGIPEPTSEVFLDFKESGNEMLVFYILAAVLLILIFIFRKHIKQIISDIIEYFKRKYFKSNAGTNIINQEIITEIKKVKKTRTSYGDYLKKARKIKTLRERFMFAYNYIFWGVIKKDKDLKESATPNEVAEKYDETQKIAELYQDLKYGQKLEKDDEVLINMTVKAESFIHENL